MKPLMCTIPFLQIANAMVSTWQGPPAMKSLFTRMFCCKSCPNIVKTNNFINFQSYFLQKVRHTSKERLEINTSPSKESFFQWHPQKSNQNEIVIVVKFPMCTCKMWQNHLFRFFISCFFFTFQTMPVAMALLRDVQNLCPKDVLNFVLDLIKYNDNRKNKVQKQTVLFIYLFFKYDMRPLHHDNLFHLSSSALAPPPPLPSFRTTTIEQIWSKRSPTLWLQPSALTTRCAR